MADKKKIENKNPESTSGGLIVGTEQVRLSYRVVPLPIIGVSEAELNRMVTACGTHGFRGDVSALKTNLKSQIDNMHSVSKPVLCVAISFTVNSDNDALISIS